MGHHSSDSSILISGSRWCVISCFQPFSPCLDLAAEVMAAMSEEVVTILKAVGKRGWLVVVAAAYVGIKKLRNVLRDGSEKAAGKDCGDTREDV